MWYFSRYWVLLRNLFKKKNHLNETQYCVVYCTYFQLWQSHDMKVTWLRSGIFTVQYCTCVVWSLAVKTTVTMTVICLTISLVKHCTVENGSCKLACSIQFLCTFCVLFLGFIYIVWWLLIIFLNKLFFDIIEKKI